MPSNIAAGVKRLGVRRRSPIGGALDVKSLTVVPPYLGYCPDLNPSLTNLVFFEDCEGLVNQDGVLTLDSGWYRLEDDGNPTLPLGGYEDHTTGNDVPEAPVTLGYAQPVILLCEISRSDGGDPKRIPFAATGLSTVIVAPAAPVHGTSDVGFCWWYDGTDWDNVPWDTVAPYGSQILGDRENLFDWAPFPIGGTALPGGVNPGAIYFTNFVDQVYKWDPGVGGAIPGEYMAAFKNFPEQGEVFKAKTVDLMQDRLVFGYTEEGGDLFNKRIRWTNIAAAPDLTSAGAGFIDFVEFKGDALRVLSFQDTCACYFEDGVGLLWRTDNSTNPFRRTYLTKERGLVGTHALCRVNNDLHFGIFEDGWFFLSAGGSWQEAGMHDTGKGRVTKWSRKFYEKLKVTEKDTTVVSFDAFTRRIRISFPSTDSDIFDQDIDPDGYEVTKYYVWIYDLDSDSVWPDEPYNPVCWGEAAAALSETVTWASHGGTWADATGSWGDYATVYGDRAVLHGTEGGLIHLHTPLLVLRDAGDNGTNSPINWFIESHKDIFGDQYSLKTSDRMLVQHNQVDPAGGFADTFIAGVMNEETTMATAVIDQSQGGTNRTTSVIHPVINGYAIGTRMSGSSPVKLYDWQVTMRPSMVPDKEPT